jgi:hypothetical protein
MIFQKIDWLSADASHGHGETGALAPSPENDSGMAPQAVEIAQNRLGNGERRLAIVKGPALTVRAEFIRGGREA